MKLSGILIEICCYRTDHLHVHAQTPFLKSSSIASPYRTVRYTLLPEISVKKKKTVCTKNDKDITRNNRKIIQLNMHEYICNKKDETDLF